MGGWFEFNAKDAARRRREVEAAKRNLDLAQAYGAPVMLIVPGRVGGIPLPKPAQFDLAFDARTLALTRATADGGFAAYVAAQNDATKYAQDALGELAPLAAERAKRERLAAALDRLGGRDRFCAILSCSGRGIGPHRGESEKR